MRIVVESRLRAETPEGFARNFRYLLWCMRAVWLIDEYDPLASHCINPWFMDDTIPSERQAGWRNGWVWSGQPHWFFSDLGISEGMQEAERRCDKACIPHERKSLAVYAPLCWEAFQRGEWPPHTPGFELSCVASEAQVRP